MCIRDSNATITGLKFFFDITLDRAELMARMQPVSVPRTLPVILSREEVSRLIAAAGNLKHQTALSVCLLYTSDAADERSSVDLGGRRIIKKKKIDKKKDITTMN